MDQAHHHFSRAAGTYAKAGGLQQRVARKLSEYFPNFFCPTILEVGCGTGFLSKELYNAYRGNGTYILTDLASNMVSTCRDSFKKASFVLMDGERPAFAPQSFDLIASSMTIQWFDDPAKALEDLKALLKPDGELLYATIGPQNFKEWREILARHGIDGGMRDDLPERLPGQFTEQVIRRDYGDARGFLSMLKETGAGKPKADYQRPSPRAFKAACDAFDGKVSWHIVYGQLEP